LDPLLALAERIRAAQTAAAGPVRAPQLRELAAAVGVGDAPTLELIPVPVTVALLPAPVALAPQEIREQPAAPLVQTLPVPMAYPVSAPLPPPAVPQEIREEPPAPLVQPAPVALADPIQAPLPPPVVPQEIREELAAPLVAAPVALADPISAPLPLPMVPQEVREEPAAPLVQAAPVALVDPIQAPLPPPIPQEIHEQPPVPVALAEPAPPPLPPGILQDIREQPPVPPAPVALAEPAPPPLPPGILQDIREQPPAPPAPLALADPGPLPSVPQEIHAPPPAAMAESVPALLPLPIAPQAPPESRAEPLLEGSQPPMRETSAEKPPSGSWLKLAPLQSYSAAAARAMRPAAPPVRILTPDSGPRVTLPGPALPPHLNVRQDLQVATAVLGERARKRRGMPGWVISFLVMATILVGGGAVLFYVLPASHTTADAKTAAPEPVVATPAVEPAHPLAQYIEVTGFRFVMDLNKKSEIHYLVVNHSAAELSDMTVFVTVRTAGAKAGQPPLCRFSFRSTGLAPFESKEMTSSIEKLPRPVTLPDWHDLRAEVQIAQ
jgi:hypothetical protein